MASHRFKSPEQRLKWAMNAWSRVCQRRISSDEVLTYAREHGWPQLEAELHYWLRVSRAPKVRTTEQQLEFLFPNAAS